MRAEGAHHAHHVAEQGVAGPVPERLVGALRVAEVVGPREVLPRPVHPPRGEQLLGAHDAERLAQLVADQVLPAVAAREREVGDVGVAPAREERDEPGVLVVRVRRHHQHPRRDAEPRDRLRDGRRAAGGGRLLRGERGGEEREG
ncbi:MAG: hypothetical protein AVDCRST_MAG40-3304 [uncultured Gemmatimonadaceae bacterium]|uniref:Uncharacterized protein n=1 Tax=uncultured Gemmatimonadaceae bacterium TaxID=246130 RepID=A0A6J4ML30_9BACT|nr:MAG: hypothetical protein AVDCRST_MAG40-3304 [uncultured Gemmatimonadaceae bacterium]